MSSSSHFFTSTAILVCLTANCPVSTAEEPQSWITSWNAYSKQFIDAPAFRLLPMPDAVTYRARVKQAENVWTAASPAPRIDLSEFWGQVAPKRFLLTIEWVGGDGAILRTEAGERVKAPDFTGFNEPPVDWVAAADRNVAHLIWAAEQGPATYREPGVPVWIWTATPSHDVSYPCITVNNIAWAFLAHVENAGPQSADAMRLARAGADWVLAHRQPETAALPLFPYSTVTRGQFGGSVEGGAVNLLRASWLAISYVDLHAATQHTPYLDYARHIADTTVKFQNADGSFPYRVDPESGAVVEQYNCSVMEFVELVEKLAPYGFDARRALAAERALEWMLAYVAATNNWKAAYEDVGEQRFYTNLSQMAAMPLIRYLCRHKKEDPDYLPLAIRLNRWVEDQFIAFSPDNEASPVRVKGPQVFEQFVCWWPMDGHTANWILALIALHKATSDSVYLNKAKAAANAICSEQYEDGQFSTWGRDFQTGESPGDNANWYNGNAFADWALYKLHLYMEINEPK